MLVGFMVPVLLLVDGDSLRVMTAPTGWCYGAEIFGRTFSQKFLAEFSGRICRGLLLSVLGCTGCAGDSLTLGDPLTLGYLASFHFDQTSVWRVHTVCGKVSLMPRASGHSLALRLIPRATILATEYLAIIGATMYLATIGYLATVLPVAAASRVLVVQSS